MVSTRARNERGAAAVLFALLAVLLLGIGAFAVDFGQAYAKKSLIQTDVDLAALAAAAELDDEDSCNSDVVTKATEFLKKSENAVPGQATDGSGGVAVDLDNLDHNDGYIICEDWTVKLWAPYAHVPFGLARALPGNFDGVDVDAEAWAQVRAARAGATLPFFAVTGCDYGLQSIRNDSKTPSTPPAPDLLPDSVDKDNSLVFTISTNPNPIPTGTDAVTVTLTGKDLGGVTQVGFATATAHHEVTISTTPKGTTTITVTLPNEVRTVDDTWFVRVMTPDKKGLNSWSSDSTAQSLTVGPPKLYCDASNEGNFGTIDVPRSDPAHVVEMNIIWGVEPALEPHPSPTGECSSLISENNNPVDGTNCVATEPGLKVAETNRGLITGVDADDPGRLDSASTSNCSRAHSDSRTSATILGTHINDDLLSCFISNGATIGDLVSSRDESDDGYHALSADIFNSPRFFWVPIFNSDPDTGKKYWPIKEFRPGFISEERLTDRRDAHGDITDLNGLVSDDSGHNIRELKVILFDRTALPDVAPTVGGEGDYTGAGPKAIVLVK
ncbi:hypothetical protein GCM10009844_31310 [Nocardioides koreensis]|uniref:Putative Flp pilus-assembly TadG-like N-terminal domain-containing protein n=1 Tax=Nocardioides koreensis TaxID=433651 RepID=A0ABP5LN16_9ACTN